MDTFWELIPSLSLSLSAEGKLNAKVEVGTRRRDTGSFHLMGVFIYCKNCCSKKASNSRIIRPVLLGNLTYAPDYSLSQYMLQEKASVAL